ncbi:TPA: DUF3298 domain-containing protein [Campylobacter lari subsp. concheus]|uniref:DUF3298 and DUF4163 domain-containing protein n=1 Tax=Campylobacter TaxID=194 RepID=UPI000B3FE67A|nr:MULTISPECIES: DUF3298 and DUF4163 domain-containing protein [Campylobacter]EAJ6151489.1 DUF3298 and DUF4163 domain-containing protein [Campylobacter lari]MBT0816508.1 DUF4163 domain-containing protein [Campylobacter lari]MBT0828427.1 DUF4163 domain-containing protein [Campylobacter lari]MCV3551939.1 DUF3298 and DUF4163 domain-containing protein [Campylobacter sp. CNRCH_2013_0855]
MFKKIALSLSLCVSLYAYNENTFTLNILEGKEFDIYLYSSSKSNTSYGFVQTKQKQYNFWGSAKNDEYYIDIADFGTCVLKDIHKNNFEALCKIDGIKKEFNFLANKSNASIYQLSLKEQKQVEDNKSIEFDFSEDILKLSSQNKNLEKIIDDFNENLDKNSLKQKVRESFDKWNKEDISNNEFFSQAYIIYQDEHIVSLGKNIYEYKGGAHGMTNFLRKTYSIDDMKLLRLKNELKIENEDFQNMIKQKILSLYNENELFDIKELKISEIFEVRKNGLVLIWEPYDIAPYSTGVIEIFISYDELKPFWKNNSKLAYLSKTK